MASLPEDYMEANAWKVWNHVMHACMSAEKIAHCFHLTV